MELKRGQVVRQGGFGLSAVCERDGEAIQKKGILQEQNNDISFDVRLLSASTPDPKPSNE